jgi:hypothetical protein
MPSESSTLPAGRPNWWKRNWKWFVPVACVVGLAELVVFFLIIAGSMKTMGPFQEALERVRADAAVVEALGTPIEDGFFVAGKVRVHNDTGSANIQFPVSGPKGRATVVVVATRSDKIWRISRLEVIVTKTNERLQVATSEATSGGT